MLIIGRGCLSSSDRVSKTLKTIEHILDWQPSTIAQTEIHTQTKGQIQPRGQTAGHTAFLGAPTDKYWNAFDSRCAAPRLGSGTENDSATVNDSASGHKDNDNTNRWHFTDQRLFSFTTNADKCGHIERESLWKSVEDAGYGCEAAPIPTGRHAYSVNMRTSHEKPRLPTNQTIDYCCNIGQITNRANLADDNYATGYVETNALGAYDSDSESDDCCKKYGFSRRRSVVECCDKHRYNRAIVLADVCRDSSRGVSGSRKNNQTTQLLPQQQVRTSTKTNGDMFGRKKQRSSWVSIPPPDADRSTEASSEARKTMDRLSQSSELHRDNAAKDIQRSSAVDRDVANTATSNEGQAPFQPDSARKTIALNGEGNRRDSRDTKKSVAFERDCCSEFNNTSNKAIKEENDVQPDSTRKMTTGNSDSKGRGTFGADERPFALDNRRDSDAREDTRRTSKAPAENESDVEEQAFETNVKAARESSVSDAEPCQSRSSADSHGMYEGRVSLAVECLLCDLKVTSAVKDDHL